jgi:hypothetical protein
MWIRKWENVQMGPSLTHFISKYFAKKRDNLLFRGKLSSLIA